MKIVYIAGPITGDGTYDNIESNVREAEKYQISLANRGIGFFCPHTHTAHHSRKGSVAPEQFYYELGFYFLTHIADAVLILPNSGNSWGVNREINLALARDIKIFYPQNPNDIESIIEWAKE